MRIRSFSLLTISAAFLLVSPLIDRANASSGSSGPVTFSCFETSQVAIGQIDGGNVTQEVSVEVSTQSGGGVYDYNSGVNDASANIPVYNTFNGCAGTSPQQCTQNGTASCYFSWTDALGNEQNATLQATH